MPKKIKSIVRNDLLIDPGTSLGGGAPIQVGSPSWFTWLGENHAFIFDGSVGHLSARFEQRRGTGYWYGYRRREGKLTKLYLGKSGELTWERLEQASAQLAGQLPLEAMAGGAADLSANPLPATPADHHPGAIEEGPFLPLTKIKPPAFPQRLLERSRLTEAVTTPVTIVQAPSGYGKTTFLNIWRRNADMPVAWVSLDAEDDHPLRFWYAVIRALQAIVPGLGRAWFSGSGDTAPSSLPKVVVYLTNDLVRLMERPEGPSRMALVLDDYHNIQCPEIHTAVQNLLDHMPPALELLFSSRTKPPLALGYQRARGMVVELGPEDLRFTLDEGIEFLRQHPSGKHLAFDDMQALVKRTEGWITGLVLALSALDQLGDRSRLREAFGGSYPSVRDFFEENVTDRQLPEVQEFLMKTSILKQLNGPLCDAVTGSTGAAAILSRLFEERLFVGQLESTDQYRYHTLFAELLSARLGALYPSEIRRLHRRAAAWYLARGAPMDAISHLVASEDWDEAAYMIESIALGELETLGQGSRLLTWLRQLPEAVVEQHRILLGLYLRLSRIALPPAEAEALLARMESDLLGIEDAELSDSAKEAQAELRLARGSWAPDGERMPAARRGEETHAWQMLDEILRYRRDFRHDLLRAEAGAGEVYKAAQEGRHCYGILVAGGDCANLALSRGHFRRSEHIAQQVLRQASELCGKLPESASIALTALGNVYFMRNQLSMAHQILIRAAEVDPNPASSNGPLSMAILHAKIQSAQGDHEAAFATMQAARRLLVRRPSSMWLDQDLVAYQELFRLRRGDLATAELLLNESVDIETHAFSALVQAEILIEQKRSVAAEDILNRLLARCPDGFFMLPILRARVILAIALFDQRKVNEARKVMAEAAQLAAPEYFIRPFLDHGAKIVPLFSLLLRSESLGAGTRSFLTGVLAMLGHTKDIPRIYTREEPAELDLAAAISPRELETLRMLGAGLSNREIADRLFISANTVKTHIENLFSKLEVNSRTQAVAKGRTLGLI